MVNGEEHRVLYRVEKHFIDVGYGREMLGNFAVKFRLSLESFLTGVCLPLSLYLYFLLRGIRGDGSYPGASIVGSRGT